MIDRQPSLLVFTRSAASECARRRLLPSRFATQARKVLRHSLDAALEAGRLAGCRIELSSTRDELPDVAARFSRQRGATFGERFRNALDDALDRAEGPVVAVGSDVPGLSARHVRQALERLGDSRDRVVIGPSPDGGFYLLATHRKLADQLSRVRWCSRSTLATLRAALAESGIEVCLLEPLRDLDRAQDLSSWLAREAPLSRRWKALVAWLRVLLADLCRPPVPALATAPRLDFRHPALGRAPPA